MLTNNNSTTNFRKSGHLCASVSLSVKWGYSPFFKVLIRVREVVDEKYFERVKVVMINNIYDR